MKRIVPVLLTLLLSTPLLAFEVVVNVQHATCGGATGNIYTYAIGGLAPYTYLWNTGVTTSSLFNVAPGSYTLTVTDSNAEEVLTTVELIATTALFPPIVPTAPAWACDDQCSGYWNMYIPLVGQTMNVVFDPPGPIGNASPNGLYFSGLCPDAEYNVTVTDINGCWSTVGPLQVLGDMAPDLLSSEVTGSCPGGATGSMTLTFSALDTLLITGPNGSGMSYQSNNPFTATNLMAGTYTVSVNVGGATSPPGGAGPYCSSTFQIVVPVSTDPCGSVSGVMYADLDGGCTQDAGDLGLPYRIVSIEPGGHLTITNATGEYATELFYDDYTLDASIADYAVICPTLPAAFTLDAATPSATIDLAMDPLFGADVSAFLSMGVHRPGFPVVYFASVNNVGPFSFTDLTLDLYFDPLLTFVNAAGSPVLVGPGHLQWTIASLDGFTNQAFAVNFIIPANAGLIGTVVNGSATVTGTIADANPANDSYTATRTIVGSYDPNDKQAVTSSRSSGTEFFLEQDEWVDYTVRFQNTGTAEAINVFVTDTIAPELDILSLEILATSHAFGVSLRPGRVLRFDFPNILLPDSTTDLVGSQGFASFRLRPVDGLMPGTILSNNADIFFDFNEPIRTNDAELMVEFSTDIEVMRASQLHVFPNPVTDRLVCNVPEGRWTAEIVGMDGRVAFVWQQSGARLTFDAGQLAPGSYVLRTTDRNGSTRNTAFVKQ